MTEMQAPDDATATGDAASGPGNGGRRRPAWAVPGLVALVMIVGVALFFVTRSDSDGGDDAATGSATTAAPATTVPSGFTTHTDPEAGFSISFPQEWKQVRPPEGDLRLLLSAGGGDSLLVRVIELEQEITQANLADVKSFTDSIVRGSEVQVLQERAVQLSGMPGYYYLYSFTDAETGAQGLHAHYFLFQGRKMNTLVFQALPADNFSRLAGVFDTVAESFKSSPSGAARSGQTTTTTGR